jgi:hypothetical protein
MDTVQIGDLEIQADVGDIETIEGDQYRAVELAEGDFLKVVREGDHWTAYGVNNQSEL